MTTLIFPTNTADLAKVGQIVVVRPGQPFTTIASPTSSSSTAVGVDFTLYFAITSDTSKSIINVNAATSSLSVSGAKSVTAAVPIYLQKPGTSTPVASNFTEPYTLAAQDTLFVPVTAALQPQVTLSTFVAQFQNVINSLNHPASGDNKPGISTSIQEPPASVSSGSPGISSSLQESSALASSSASSSSSPTNTPVPDSANISKGALAGGIIGAFLGGLLLGALILFCLGWRRRHGTRKSEPSSQSIRESKTPILYQEQSTRGGEFELTRHASTAYSGWRKHVPQAESESTMRGKFMQLSQFITMHVEQHYISRNTTSSSNLARVAAIDSSGAQRFNKIKDVTPLLNRTIASFIIARISLQSDPADSFLPTEFTVIPKMNEWNMEAHDSTEIDGRRGVLPALADWRVLTAFLYKNDDQRMNSELKVKVDRAIRLLDAELADYAKQRRSPDRDRSLEQIISLASTAGRELFKQLPTFHFDWLEHQNKQNADSIVVFPALLRVRDESGRSIQAETVFEATWKQIR